MPVAAPPAPEVLPPDLRRRLYLRALWIIVPVAIILILTAFPDPSTLRLFTLLVTAGWATILVLFSFRKIGLRVVEVGVFALAVVVFLTIFLTDLLRPVPHVSNLFLGIAPLLYLWAFLAFGQLLGLRLSLAYYLLTLLMGAGVYGRSVWMGTAQHPEYNWQVYVFFYALSPVYMVLVSAMAALIRAGAEQRVEALTQAVYTDPLTGLPNRLAFREELERAVVSCTGAGWSGTLALLNINGFVNINDELGHRAGDLTLSLLAQRWEEALPSQAHLSRINGDEFALVLCDRSAAQAESHLRQLLDLAQRPMDIMGVMRTLSVRCGAAHFPANGTDPAAVNIAADLAQAEAQRSQEPLVVYSPQLALLSERRRRVLGALALAPERQELWLAFQPIVSLGSGQVASVEALLRWDSALTPPPRPEEFVALAEEAGLMDLLGDWVLRAALDQMAQWRRSGLNVPRINVNVAPQELLRGNYAERVLQYLSDLRLPPGMLELELTERTVLEEAALLQLRVLRSAGVCVSIDDFGTGHSSLGRLHALPITGVKLDRTFISMLGQDGSADRLSRTVLTLARAMDLEVVAEGIETPAQLALLRELGCPLGQGYLFTRPLNATDFQAFVQEVAAQEEAPSPLAD